MDTDVSKESEVKVVEKRESDNSPLVSPEKNASEDVRGYLLKEIEASSRAIRRTCWLGAFLVVFIASYSVWVYSTIFGDFLTSDTLSEIIVGEVEMATPEILEEIKTEATAQAPVLIGTIRNQLFSETKGVRFAVGSHVDGILEAMPVLREEMIEGFGAYFEVNRERMKVFAESHSDEQFVEYFVEELSAQITVQLDEIFSRHGEIQSKSLEQLNLLNTDIATLATKNRFRITEQEALRRRVYASWLRVLEQYLEFSAQDLDTVALGG